MSGIVDSTSLISDSKSLSLLKSIRAAKSMSPAAPLKQSMYIVAAEELDNITLFIPRLYNSTDCSCLTSTLIRLL